MFHLFDLIKEVHRNKSIARIMLNWHIKEHCNGMTGIVVDLASGNPSYYKYINHEKIKIIRADCDKNMEPDIIIDFNKALPFKDGEVNHILFFNALYVAKSPQETLGECARILKDGGTLYVGSPFIFNESREPHDYFRFTSEKLEQMLYGVGFRDVEIIPMGERFTAASFLVGTFLFFSSLRFALYAAAILFDRILPKKIKRLHPCPIGYFCIAKK